MVTGKKRHDWDLACSQMAFAHNREVKAHQRIDPDQLNPVRQAEIKTLKEQRHITQMFQGWF